ncbi:MAG: nucleotide exchange factor GrpE [Desulfomonilaceae bacterium]
MTDDTRNSHESRVSEQETNAAAAPVEKHPPTAPMPVQGEGAGAQADQESKETDPLEEAKKLASENRDRWLRAVADLENFKKRNAQERAKLIKYQNEDLLRDLLTISDNLERALSHCDEKAASSGLVEGIRLVANMLKDTMSKYGVSAIECVGKPFDPTFHEAIGKVPGTGAEPNTIVEELEKGYMYHDRLLRPAKVTIAA